MAAKKSRKREKAVKKSGGRPPTLTPAIAADLEAYWMLSGEDTLTDEEIAARIGTITYGQLRGWLQHNTKVLIDREQIGLCEVRRRARATTKSGYLQRLYNCACELETSRRQDKAATIWQWLLEKQFPRDFGNLIKIRQSRSEEAEMSDEQLQAAIARDLKLLGMKG